MQKGGEILNAVFPRTYSLHGGEHVISLFFSDLAKQDRIKVSSDMSAPFECNSFYLAQLSCVFFFSGTNL